MRNNNNVDSWAEWVLFLVASIIVFPFNPVIGGILFAILFFCALDIKAQNNKDREFWDNEEYLADLDAEIEAETDPVIKAGLYARRNPAFNFDGTKRFKSIKHFRMEE